MSKELKSGIEILVAKWLYSYDQYSQNIVLINNPRTSLAHLNLMLFLCLEGLLEDACIIFFQKVLIILR